MTAREAAEDRVPRYTPVRIAAGRIGQYWAAVYAAWRTAFDWTALLYLVVPGLWIAGGMYADFWQHPPDWLPLLPPGAVLAATALLTSGGKARTFAYAGDGLFLRRNRSWTVAMWRIGLLYTFGARLLAAAAVTGLLAPAYRMAGCPAPETMLLALLAATGGYVAALLRDGACRRWIGWRRWAAEAGIRLLWPALLAASTPAVATIPGVLAALTVAIAAAAALTALRLRAGGSFAHEVETEREAYTAMIGVLVAEAVEKRALPRSSRPRLFRGESRLLRGREPWSRLAELAIKALLRKWAFVRTYVQIVSLGAAAMLWTPIPLSAAVWIALSGVAAAWADRNWRQWLDEPYPRFLRWPADVQVRAGRRLRQLLGYPAVALWGLELGLRIGLRYGDAWWAVVLAAPALGWLVLRTVNAIMAEMEGFRKKREERSAS